MFQIILNVILIFAVVRLFREVRTLNKIVDARGNVPPVDETSAPRKTAREEAVDAVRIHQQDYHRGNQ